MMLTRGQLFSLVYHDIFEYPLTEAELIKWKAKDFLSTVYRLPSTARKKGFYFLKGKEVCIKKRLEREKFSLKKVKIAKKAAKILGAIPTVKMVAIAGSLAMANARKDSDVDLLVITKKETLWITRALALAVLTLSRVPIRRVGNKDEKDKICINIWLDETALSWSKKSRNIYTAHEISQIIPLVNKEKIYERFLWENRWILKYWPKAANIKYEVLNSKYYLEEKKTAFFFKKLLISTYYLLLKLLELLAFRLQYIYMKLRITRETITPTRALFHPVDWAKIVLKKLRS